MAKKNKGKNATKGGRQSKYKKRFAEDIYWMVVECGLVNTRGQIAWNKIAKIWGVSESLIRRWLNRLDGDYYKADFAAAVKQAIEALDLGGIKRDTITAAGRHIKHRRIRELVAHGPKPPRSSYTKAILVRYAAEVLKPPLTLDVRRTKAELLYEIEQAIEGQTTQKMEVVRTESQEVYGEPSARAVVLANLGPENERWMAKEVRTHDTTGELAKLMAEIGEQPTVLPCEELGITHDGKRLTEEPKEPVLADEQSVLDHG